jgi:hypothetical protein
MSHRVWHCSARLAGALALLFACGRPAEVSRAAPAPPTKTSTTPKPANREPIVIEYTSKRGPQIARDLFEVQRTALVDTESGRATLLMTRDDGDHPGQAIGHFTTVLPPATLQKLADAGAQTDWDKLPRPSAGGPGRAWMEIKYKRGTIPHTVGFSSMDIDLMSKIALLDVLDQDVLRALYGSPHRALQVALAEKLDARDVEQHGFAFALRNVGVEPTCILDPRRLQDPDNHDAFVGVQIAAMPPEKPGFTAPPLEWRRVALPVLDDERLEEARKRHIVLAPGQSHELRTAPWSPKQYTQDVYPQTGEWLVQAIFSDYDMPDDIDGIGCTRGAAFSTLVKLVASGG